MSNSTMRRTIITFVLLALFVLCAGVVMAAWLDNTTNISDDDVTNNVRTSGHFRIVWGIQPTSSTVIDEDFIQTNLQNLEYDYEKDHTAPPYGFSFRDPSVPNPADGNNYRANLYINNTHGSPNDGFAYGWTDGRNLAECSICAEGLNPLDPASDVHPHEYGHGNIIASGGLNSSGEWHEPTANWFSCMRDDDYNDPINYSASWFPYPHGRDYYDAWPIYEAFREDPNLGPLAISNGFTAGGTDYIFTAIAKQATYTTDKLGAEKTVFGEYAAKGVNYDFQRGEFFRTHDNPELRCHWVYPVKEAGSTTWYRCPWEQAPSQGGYNMIPLSASAGTTVTVNFKGVSDILRESDWRVCFVAISNNGDSRYSKFWNCGSNSITLSSDESKLYLVVACTPDFYSVSFDRDLQTSIVKEPQAYEISLTNATIPEPTNGSRGSGWHQHSNGGGWVQDTATVDSTAYVGPNAIVQDTAQVKNTAQILDYAVISGGGQVRDSAIVSGHAQVTDSAQVYGNAKVRDWGKVQGSASAYGNARILEHGTDDSTVVCDNACVRGYAWWYGGTLNGYAIADGDAGDGSNLDHGTSTGWSWGPNQAYNDALPDSGGIFCQYKFDNPDPVYAKDTYGLAWGYLINKPAQVLTSDTYRATVLQLDGSTQYIECPKNLTDIKDTTIAVWVYWTGTANDQRIFSFGDGANKYMYLTPKDTTNGKVKFVISNNGTGGEQTLVGAAAIPASTWTHVAIILSGNTGTLYVNGTSVATNSSMTLNPDDLMNPNTLAYSNCNYIGKGPAGNFFQGYLDDFRLYSLAKTGTDVSTMASQYTTRTLTLETTAPSPTVAWYKFDETSGSTASDSSGSGKNGTCNGGYTWGAGYINNCITLNGSTGYVSLPNGLVSGLTDFSITTWVYFNAFTDWERVFDFGTGSTNYMFLGVTGSHLRYAINVNGGGEQIVDSSTTLTTGAWHLIAVTQTAGTVNIYVDGAQAGSGAVSSIPSNLGTTTQTWIGRSQYGADPYLSAKVDDFRIYNRVLSAGELALFYPADTSAPTPNPATWLINPTATSDTSIAMSATKATDANGVEYSFTCTAGGGHSSGWITTNQYMDNGLTPGTQYTYTVQTRDKKGNTGSASSAQSATPASDTSAPTPNPATFAIAPKGVDTSSITMTATKGTDTNSLVEYKFTGSNGHASSWQASPIWTDTGLTSGATATYTVQMRDGRGNTGTASAASATATARDETPPHIPGATYDPITSPWFNRPVIRTNGTLYFTARTATDPSGVQYYFHCSSGGGPDSGWQDSEHWTSAAVANGTYTYQFKARDKSAQANETPYVGSETVTVTNNNIFHSYTLLQVTTAADQTLVSFSGTVTAEAANYYTVSDGTHTVKVIPATYNQVPDSSLLNKGVDVKGCMWTFTSLGKVVNYATVTKTPVPQFTITASAGTGGYISPSGAVLVDQGSNQTFTITPNPFYQISQVTVDSVNQGAISTYTFTNVQANHTISATFTAITGDMVAWWKFDETSGTTASDSSGNGKNGTLNGSCTWVAGKINNAVNIPGGTSYVSVPNNINSGVTNFSVSAWVYLNSRSANMRIFDFGSSTTSYMEMTPQHAASNGKYQFVIKSGSTTKTVTGTAALPTGSWQFVTVTLSSQTLTLYLNGAQVGQITNCSINPNSLGSTTQDRIGDSQTSSHPHLNGVVDDFRFYKRTLSLAEINALYLGVDMIAYYKFDETSGTSASDSSGHGNTGTLNGGCSWVAGKTNNAISLDGSTGYVSLPNGMVSTLNDFSIVAWVNLTANNGWNRLFDFGTGTSNYMFLSPSAGGGAIRYAITTSGGGGEQQINGSSALGTGAWHHVAVTLSGTTGTLYVDGGQVGQNTSMTLKPSSLGTTTQTWIGRSQYADPYFNGLIDGFRVYTRALSGTEISTLYGGGAGAASFDGDDSGWDIIPAK